MDTPEINDAERDEIIQQAARKEIAETLGATLDAPEPKQEPQVVEPQDAPSDSNDETEKGPSIEDRIASLVEENKRLQRSIDTTNGRYGNEVQRLRTELNDLKKPSELQELVGNLDINNPAFQDIREEFPELGERFLSGIKKALTKAEVAADAKAIQTVTADAATQDEPKVQHDQFNVEMAIDKLSEKHPDFEQVAKFSIKNIAPGIQKIEWKNPEFGEFVESLDDDERNLVIHGESPSDILKISKILTKYKESLTTADADQDESEDTQQKQTAKKIKPDLTRSILPDSKQKNGRVALTDEEIIEAAKRAEIKRVMGG